MDDLISRQAAIDVCKEIQKTFLGDYFDPDSAEYIGECISELENLPSAQPERKKGKWIETDKHDIYYQPGYKCSVCGVLTTCHGGYCPNCGADMRGESHEND